MRGATALRTAEMCQPVTASIAPSVEQPVDVRGHLRRPSTAVDHDEAQLTTQHSAVGVHLFGGEPGAQFAGGAEEA